MKKITESLILRLSSLTISSKKDCLIHAMREHELNMPYSFIRSFGYRLKRIRQKRFFLRWKYQLWFLILTIVYFFLGAWNIISVREKAVCLISQIKYWHATLHYTAIISFQAQIKPQKTPLRLLYKKELEQEK